MRELVEVVVKCWLRHNVHIHIHVDGELVDVGEGILVGIVGVGRRVTGWEEEAWLDGAAGEVLPGRKAGAVGGVVFVRDEGVGVGKVACIEGCGWFVEFAEDFATAAEGVLVLLKPVTLKFGLTMYTPCPHRCRLLHQSRGSFRTLSCQR